MRRLTITRADCHVEFDWFLEGSVKAGTVSAGATACRTRLEIDSPEPEAAILRLIKLAKQGCFVEQMIQTPVPLGSVCVVNGQEAALPDSAAEPSA